MKWDEHPNKRSLAILRVSSYRQKDNTSHDVQRAEIEAYASSHGLAIEDTARIVESAKDSEDRDKFHAAIDKALRTGIRNILYYGSSGNRVGKFRQVS